MFAKLLKHEWKSVSRLLGIFSLAALGVGVLATVSLRLILYFGERAVINETQTLLLVPVFALLLVFSFLALIVYLVGTEFFLIYRFYKNKFTDEGYLTFTLPVSAHKIVLSSWLNMLIWFVICAAVFFLCMFCVVVVGTAQQGFINTELLRETDMGFLYTLYKDLFGEGYLVISSIASVAGFLASPMIIMGCITLGAVMAKKHKILMSIAIYYIYSMILGIGTSVISSLMMMGVFRGDMVTSMYISSIGSLVLVVASAVIGYFLTVHLMQKKLNLP